MRNRQRTVTGGRPDRTVKARSVKMRSYSIPASMAGGVMDGYHTVVIWV